MTSPSLFINATTSAYYSSASLTNLESKKQVVELDDTDAIDDELNEEALENLNPEELLVVAKKLHKRNQSLITQHPDFQAENQALQKGMEKGHVAKRNKADKELSVPPDSLEQNALFTYIPEATQFFDSLKEQTTFKVVCLVKTNVQGEVQETEKELDFRLLKPWYESSFKNMERTFSKKEGVPYLQDSVIYFFSYVLHDAHRQPKPFPSVFDDAKKIFPDVLDLAHQAGFERLTQYCKEYMEDQMQKDPKTVGYFFNLKQVRQTFYSIIKSSEGHAIAINMSKGLFPILKSVDIEGDPDPEIQDLSTNLCDYLLKCLTNTPFIDEALDDHEFLEDFLEAILRTHPVFYKFCDIYPYLAQDFIKLFDKEDYSRLPFTSIVMALSYLYEKNYTKTDEILKGLMALDLEHKQIKLTIKRLFCMSFFSQEKFDDASRMAQEILCDQPKDEFAQIKLILIDLHKSKNWNSMPQLWELAKVSSDQAKLAVIEYQLHKLGLIVPGKIQRERTISPREVEKTLRYVRYFYKKYKKQLWHSRRNTVSATLQNTIAWQHLKFVNISIMLFKFIASIHVKTGQIDLALKFYCKCIFMCTKGPKNLEVMTHCNEQVKALTSEPTAESLYAAYIIQRRTEKVSIEEHIYVKRLKQVNKILELNANFLPALKEQLVFFHHLLEYPNVLPAANLTLEAGEKQLFENIERQIEATHESGKKISEEFFDKIKEKIPKFLLPKFESFVSLKLARQGYMKGLLN